MAMARAVAFMLDDAEKAALMMVVCKHRAPQSLALPACIVLAAADGLTNKEISMRLGGHKIRRNGVRRIYIE